MASLQAITSDTGKIGDFNINSLGLTKTWTWTTKTFTTADETRLRNILLGNITPTSTDYAQYDINRDGRLSGLDLVDVNRAINGYTSNPLTVTYTAKIQPNDAFGTFVVENNIGDTISSMGAGRVKSITGDFDVIFLKGTELTIDDNGYVVKRTY